VFQVLNTKAQTMIDYRRSTPSPEFHITVLEIVLNAKIPSVFGCFWPVNRSKVTNNFLGKAPTFAQHQSFRLLSGGGDTQNIIVLSFN
jgi:hypothetical protein